MDDRHHWLTAALEVGPASGLVVAPSGGTTSAPVELSDTSLGAGELGRLLGTSLSELHSLPTASCPYDASTQQALEELRGEVAAADSRQWVIPEPYDRYQPAELVELVAVQLDLSPDEPPSPVVIHGDLRPHNWSLQQTSRGDVLTLDGLSRMGVGDRHRDLAVMHRYLPAVAGAEALFGFYESYGSEPDLIKLDAYVLLTLLVEQLGPIELTS